MAGGSGIESSGLGSGAVRCVDGSLTRSKICIKQMQQVDTSFAMNNLVTE